MKKLERKNGSRIEALFAALKEKKEKALITFITAGDPDLPTTKKIILELVDKGADIIELGIPFSDPMADGPTIQMASERALASGTTTSRVLSLVKEVRREGCAAPIVLFGYYNPVFVYGLDRFARDAKRAGADGVLIVDLPPEESGDLKEALEAEGMDFVYLLTPTSDASRIKLVAGRASGFVYYVSVAGVTGARKKLATSLQAAVKRVKAGIDLPIGVGFGISTPEQARAAARGAEGVIVGSAIVNIIAKHGAAKGSASEKGISKMVAEVGRFTKRLKTALR
ncbi:Tryptophan synthase alpha chain [hydrothermal vent metagenome]|uniref:tryptophan synthase n=1 Tax=hydrothermal vent metagenome TaxID=652676 RepID=A0A3B0VF55_9ZZZZ